MKKNKDIKEDNIVNSNEQCNCEDKCNCHEECQCGDECCCNDNNEALNNEIALLKEKVSKLEDSLLREKAEVSNFKRRNMEEMDRILKYKNEDILSEFLPIIDNFERAIKMDDNDISDEVSKFLEGFKIIYGNTLNLLNKFDVKEIDAEGIEFDPTYHHAVLTEHDENKPEGVILEVLQKGYMYKDKVIRPSMVKVNE